MRLLVSAITGGQIVVVYFLRIVLSKYILSSPTGRYRESPFPPVFILRVEWVWARVTVITAGKVSVISFLHFRFVRCVEHLLQFGYCEGTSLLTFILCE